MAARGEGANQILVIDIAAHHHAQGVGEDGQTPLDHRTGLRGVKTRVGAGSLRRSQLAWVSPSRHPVHCSVWVPGSREEPFFPLSPRWPTWICCPRAGSGLPPARVAAHAPSVIIQTRSRRFASLWRACCCGSCLIALFADRLRAERQHRNRLHQCRSAFGSVARCPTSPCATRLG